MNFEKFKAIRREYAIRIPEWMEVYEATGDMRQDAYFMDWEFTPIELDVWSDIRCLGIPFFPQLPALNYFLDFGNPFLKIGIECDGKAWHDKEKDNIRDDRLGVAGWTIFRIEGHECRRFIVPEVEFEEDPDYGAWRDYYMTTSEGVLRAIKQHYFDGAVTHFPYLAETTLFNHRSTAYQEVEKIDVIESSGPVRMSDMLDDYLALLHRRMERAA